MEYNNLTENEKEVIENKATEAPFKGEYDNFYQQGTYICRKCNSPLFSSKSKFDAGCGWPAFDKEFPNSISRLMDKDGSRVEIVCSNCAGHLGHEFVGERFTDTNTRDCVNSLSIKFVKEGESLPNIITKTEKVILASGCFWCSEALFKTLKGVLIVVPGYCGGTKVDPTYEEVVSGNTGHTESVQITYEPDTISFETILEIFFHTHNPTTLNRQGNDIGTQYRSEIFYTTENQKNQSLEYIEKHKDDFEDPIVTKVTKFEVFYPAEIYHLDYYRRNTFNPYCMFTITPKLSKLLKEYSKHIKE